jgi:hypothetical protein
VNLKKKPFSTIALNDLETLSLVTSMASIYCGLFFISEMPADYVKVNPDATNALVLSDGIKLVFFFIIVISNCIFFLYWSIKMYQEI